jgi:nucleoside phosphorylase
MTGGSPRRLRFVLVAALVAGLWAGGAGAGTVVASGAPCTPRLLLLSAFPAEIGLLLDEADVDPARTVTIDGQRFYVGTLRGNEVVLALTGIGMNNATAVTEAAFDHFACDTGPGISGVVFTGVAGGRFIGDVVVPARWTADHGATWLPTDPAMLATASAVAATGTVPLSSETPLGDPLCLCLDPQAVQLVSLGRTPQVLVGGDGTSSDPFGDKRFPCLPLGGDVFGCDPCRDPNPRLPDLARFVTGILPFVDPAFFESYFANPPVDDPAFAALDMESAASAQVAADHGVPFIAFRGASDGGGDPLHLPGFPFQFFVYRQLAADNAAVTTLAFLDAWGDAVALGPVA